MLDRTIMWRILVALDTVAPASMRESVLLNEIALEAPHHLESTTIREHLKEAEHKKWIAQSRGMMSEVRWQILEAGTGAMRELRG
jgi:hypothetical protein